jgi:hypothetical protein
MSLALVEDEVFDIDIHRIPERAHVLPDGRISGDKNASYKEVG